MKKKKPVTQEQIDAWYESGPISKEILTVWLKIIQGNSKDKA